MSGSGTAARLTGQLRRLPSSPREGTQKTATPTGRITYLARLPSRVLRSPPLDCLSRRRSRNKLPLASLPRALDLLRRTHPKTRTAPKDEARAPRRSDRRHLAKIAWRAHRGFRPRLVLATDFAVLTAVASLTTPRVPRTALLLLRLRRLCTTTLRRSSERRILMPVTELRPTSMTRCMPPKERPTLDLSTKHT